MSGGHVSWHLAYDEFTVNCCRVLGAESMDAWQQARFNEAIVTVMMELIYFIASNNKHC